MAPAHRRVAGDGIVADWDKTAPRSSEANVTKVLETGIDKTVHEILTTRDVLVGTFELSGGGDEDGRISFGKWENPIQALIILYLITFAVETFPNRFTFQKTALRRFETLTVAVFTVE